MTPVSPGRIPRTLWTLLAVAAVAGMLAFLTSFNESRNATSARRADVQRAQDVSEANQRLIQQVKCTQALILSILNDTDVQARIQAHQPIPNPCENQ